MTRHVSNGTEDTPLPNNLSREQLYYQLYNIVFQDITNGVYEVGDLIPSETEYMQKFSVSRATVRKAMEMLVNNGLIVRRRGCGSEVVSAKPATALRSVESCIKRLTSDHVIPIKRVVSAEMTTAGKDVADALNVRTGSSVYRLERVRCAGRLPIIARRSALPTTMRPPSSSTTSPGSPSVPITPMSCTLAGLAQTSRFCGPRRWGHGAASGH